METTIRQRVREHADAVARLDETHVAAIAAAAALLNECLDAGGAVFVCGNGGSGADAQHIAGELVGRYLTERRALPCVALTADSTILTCVGNDYGFDHVFSRQVEGLVRGGDVLWGLSTSGNSPNILHAMRAARDRGAKTLAAACDVCFTAPATGSFAIQQIHQVAYHLVCELVEAHAAGDEGRMT